MKGLANATEASQLGLEMSIALVATMYGLLIANFIVNPAGELLVKKSEEEEEYADIALEAILLFKDGESLLESQEALNAMVPDEQRLELQSHA
jgi:chemotaxis protein MotA